MDVGDRISLNGDNGTVKWIGEVKGAKGTWIGVEWDDASRGKHDGVKDGVRYFTCSVPNAGSFIRSTAAISKGRSFMDAFLSKYADALHSDAAGVEMVTLGSSKGAIQVEAPDLNKIRARISDWARLREISLDGELVSSAGPESEISGKFPGLRGLDLTRNLLPTWNDVAQIASQLPSLQSLSLNDNRLHPLPTPFHSNAFPKLIQLRLSNTLTTWDQFSLLSSALPLLQEVHLGENRIQTITTRDLVTCEKLETLHLGGNALESWPDTVNSLSRLPALSRLILTANKYTRIPLPTGSDQILPGLKYLAFSENGLASLSDIDALAAWFPSISSLVFSENPLLDVLPAGNGSQIILARLPSLQSINGSTISASQRQDAELFYLSSIAKETWLSADDRLRAHPLWQQLCDKYGEPLADKSMDARQKLGDRLLNIRVVKLAGTPPQRGTAQYSGPTAELRVLKTMSIRVLAKKICKQLKLNARQTVRLYLLVEGDKATGAVELDDNKDVDWAGIEENSLIGVLEE